MKRVIVRLGNGLGNQLFTYAAAYSFAKKNNAELYVDDVSGFHKKHKGYKYELHNLNITAPIVDKRYKFNCIQEEWFYCPPLNAIWQFKIITDICKDPPKVLEVGECVEKFECDPSNTTVEILDCFIDDAQGTQEKWCEKGVYKYSECTPCEPEICDGWYNDC